MQTLDGALDTTSVQLDHRKTFPQFRESAEAADELHFSTQKCWYYILVIDLAFDADDEDSEDDASSNMTAPEFHFVGVLGESGSDRKSVV